MPLLKTINTPSGKRPLGWVVATSEYGNVLVVRRMPSRIAVSTKRAAYISINDSADNDEAGWSLDDTLIQALKRYDCKKVAVFVKKPGMLYMTDAANYFKGGVVYLVSKGQGARVRCVGLDNFDRRPYRVKI